MSKVAIFASGAGSNAATILHFLNEKQSSVKVALIVTNKKEAGIYQVAENHQLPIFYFSRL